MMKRILVIATLLLLMTPFYGQLLDTTIIENFDGNPPVTFTSVPATGIESWQPHTAFYVNSPNSYRARVPVAIGDTTMLLTPMYDLGLYRYIQFRFWHICKISPRDRVSIDYRADGTSTWVPLPNAAYLGSASNYALTGFNGNSYSEWKGNDSTALPTNSWWQEEVFDIGPDVKNSRVQFRFIIIHGSVPSTNIAYGWLLDKFEIRAANYQIIDPVVQFAASCPKDTAYSTGPWRIEAKVATRTAARIEQPYLIWTASVGGQHLITDSVLMTNIAGDSIWEGYIPQYQAGTDVVYSITGRDTTGNRAMTMSAYHIKQLMGGGGELILQDGSTSSGNYPFYHGWGYSRAMALYPAAEMTQPLAGLVSTLALRVSTAGSAGFPMKIWLTTVPASKTTWTTADNLDWAVLTQNATLVYDGIFHFTPTGWVDIALQNMFLYNGTDNLVVMFEQNCGGSSCGTHMSPYSNYYYSTTQTERLWLKYSDSNPPTATTTLYRYANRPDMRINVIGSSDSNSVALHSIDMTDTIAVRAGVQTPLIVTLKNKGAKTLESATIYYTINNSAPISYNWNSTPGLPWDFNSQVTIGNYQATINGNDTITVWVESPNGVYDSTTWDDTLTKVIYGTSDFRMYFVDHFTDTVMTTGGFAISAHLSTYSSRPVGNVTLEVESTRGGVTTPLSIPMLYNLSKGLYEAEIPQSQFGTHVVYGITKTDYLGNIVSIVDSFYIKRVAGTDSDSKYTYVGDTLSATTNSYVPFYTFWDYSWSRTMVHASELNENSMGGVINSIGFMPTLYSRTTNRNNQSLYFKAVSDVDIITDAWVDPVADGATLVWQGTIPPPPINVWMDVPLDNPFTLPANSNLLVYWVDNDGAYAGSVRWKSETTTTNMSAYDYADIVFPTGTGDYATYRPVMRFDMPGRPVLNENNSVALETIESPLAGAVTAGQPIPVIVSLRNKGITDLDSCTINWSRNGNLQTPTYIYKGRYNGKLWDDFADTVTIGFYTPIAGQVDDIIVWVSLPNNVVDNVTSDDTLNVRTIACAGPLTGTYQVGASGVFPNMGSALFMANECGISGKWTLQIEDGTYNENIDLSQLNALVTAADTIEIMSLSGNAANVIFNAEKLGVKIKDMSNITIKNISMNVTGVGYGVHIDGNCNNIEINGCNIYVDTTEVGTITSHVGIYKGTANIVDNLRILNNHIIGGFAGMYVTATSTTTRNTNCICTNNISESAYRLGILFNYSELSDVSYNTVLAPTTDYIYATDWWGLALEYCLLDVVSHNRINAMATTVTSAHRGLSVYEVNQGSANSPVKLFNNEIMVKSESAGTHSFGIQNASSKTNIYHNSVYLAATTAGRALQNSTTHATDVKNNMFVAVGNPAWAIYNSGSSTTFDYNNYCYGTAMGENNAVTVPSLAAWQTTTGQDIHSITVSPQFTDINTSMELSTGFESYLCPRIATVQTDIDDNARHSFTSMGAYTIEPFNYNFTYIEFYQWEKEVIVNQTIPVEINVTNLSSIPLASVSFDWSLNGTPQTPYPYTFPSAVPAFGSAVVNIGSFPVALLNEVEVWLRSVNGSTSHPMTDSIYAVADRKPLAEFVAPFVDDTIFNLTFDVNALIRTISGAPVTAPTLDITAIINGSYTSTSSIAMTLTDGVWQATVPQQYYGSNVIYSLTVTDAISNTYTVMDSTYIKFTGFGKSDTVTIGTGTSTTSYNPYYIGYDYSWTRNYYRAHEIDINKKGGVINSIAFYTTTTATIAVDNVSFYLKAVSDSVATSGYIDPIADGATLVWGPATSTTGVNGATGWYTFVLNAPFYLPPNMNLLVYCENHDGAWGTPTPSWQYTTQAINTSIYEYDDGTFPSGKAGVLTAARPNIQIDKSSPSDPYAGNNLAILSMVSPVNVFGQICSDNFSSVQVLVTNLGENDYDFTQDPIDVAIEIDDPTGAHYYYTKTIFTGGLESGEEMVIELMPSLDIRYAGRYDMKAWLSSTIDQVIYDDTLVSQFVSGVLSLPVDEDFSTGISPLVFVTTASNSLYKWTTVEQGEDADINVGPVFGDRMLSFAGTRGASASLSVRQLQIQGTTQPTLDFWYFHDTVKLDGDYLEVKITQDGGTYRRLALIEKQDAVYGWKQYTIDLSPYTTGTCISILFNAMVVSPNTVHYIDRVRVTSLQDVAVVDVITSELDVCNLKNQTWKVVLSNGTAQAINFSTQPATLQLMVNYNGIDYPFNHQITSGIFAGNSVDTFDVKTGFDFEKGIYTATVQLTIPLDQNPANNTKTSVVTIDPKFTLDIQKLSQTGSPAFAEVEHEQVITIENTGNIDLPAIGLLMKVNSTASDEFPYSYTVKDTFAVNLAAGETQSYTIEKPYTVPWAKYTVEIYGYLLCDSAMANVMQYVEEDVDVTDLSVIAITEPIVSATPDHVGDSLAVSIDIRNRNFGRPYNNEVNVVISITDLSGVEKDRVREEIPLVIAGGITSYDFIGKYAVPKMEKYILKVYIENVDNYILNNTLTMERATDYTVGVLDREGNSFIVEQNIPNPAQGKTLINYNIPQDGEVMFNLYSVSGQLLYSQKENASFGDNQIELNISDYAAGVYIYTIEYDGQRITKRMSVKR